MFFLYLRVRMFFISVCENVFVWRVPVYSLHSAMCDLVPPGNVCNSATYWGLTLWQNPLCAFTPLHWETHWELQHRITLSGSLHCGDSVGVWHNPVGLLSLLNLWRCPCNCSALLSTKRHHKTQQTQNTTNTKHNKHKTHQTQNTKHKKPKIQTQAAPALQGLQLLLCYTE